MKKILLRVVQIVLAFYLFICIGLYFMQERLIFMPTKLAHNHSFQFEESFEELSIITKDKIKLSGLLFTTDSISKGLVFYLHGNAGSLNSWGGVATTYTSRGYDVFLLDYRGYGKSQGEIFSEEQFYTDVQMAYNEVKKRYNENKIIILGYSIGTGAASMLAANNNPKRLILQAPYYSLVDMMKQHYSFAPTFLLKYQFDIGVLIPKIKAPITIFHGDNDAIIYYGSSLKLKEKFKSTDQLITLPQGRHNGMSSNPDYLKGLDQIL